MQLSLFGGGISFARSPLNIYVAALLLGSVHPKLGFDFNPIRLVLFSFSLELNTFYYLTITLNSTSHYIPNILERALLSCFLPCFFHRVLDHARYTGKASM